MGNFEHSWKGLWQALSLPEPPNLFDRLLAAYGEPHRKYHTLQHLAECLDHIVKIRLGASIRPVLELALWFHDAVYDVHRSDNEQQSAEWAERELGRIDRRMAREVCELVLSTRHTAAPQSADEGLIVDIDLAILGAEPGRYWEYEAQIREEYAWVPADRFRKGRSEILTALLARPSIYNTPDFRLKLEGQARNNLEQSLIKLVSQSTTPGP